MNFPPLWVSWIRECISTPTFSVMVNGSPTKFFSTNKGIRQGCPLSPLLFVVAMEFFFIQMDLMTAQRSIVPAKENYGSLPSHVLFADDVLLFCKANSKCMKGIKEVFPSMQSNAGLIVILEKSNMFLNKRVRNKTVTAAALGVQLGSLPIKYIGLTLSTSYPKAKNLQALRQNLQDENWLMGIKNIMGVRPKHDWVCSACVTWTPRPGPSSYGNSLLWIHYGPASMKDKYLLGRSITEATNSLDDSGT